MSISTTRESVLKSNAGMSSRRIASGDTASAVAKRSREIDMNMQITQETTDSCFPGAGAAKRAKPLLRGLAHGTTLAEAMVCTVLVAVVALGGLSYEYLAAKHALIARAQTTATRTAQLLLEDWKSTGGSSDYDPAALGIGISFAGAASFGSYDLDTTLGGGAYSTKIDGLPMVVMLGFKDVEYDEDAQVKLRQLTVVIESGEISMETKELTSASGLVAPVIMTTYCRADASNG